MRARERERERERERVGHCVPKMLFLSVAAGILSKTVIDCYKKYNIKCSVCVCVCVCVCVFILIHVCVPFHFQVISDASAVLNEWHEQRSPGQIG